MTLEINFELHFDVRFYFLYSDFHFSIWYADF